MKVTQIKHQNKSLEFHIETENERERNYLNNVVSYKEKLGLIKRR